MAEQQREPYGDRWEECEDATAVLIRWNDAPERTKDEVLALFDAAIWATENDREPGWPPQPGTETRDV